MATRAKSIVVEIVRPASPIARPVRGDFISPTLLDSLLQMLPETAAPAAAPAPAPLLVPTTDETGSASYRVGTTTLRGEYDVGGTVDEDFGIVDKADEVGDRIFSEDGDTADLAGDQSARAIAAVTRSADGFDDEMTIDRQEIDLPPLPGPMEADTIRESSPLVFDEPGLAVAVAPKAGDESAGQKREDEDEDEDNDDTVRFARQSKGQVSGPPQPRNVQERLRGLNPADQLKVARTGEVTERKVLERLYGKNVWEALLRNPKLTPPEVTRIARMGTLPLPLVDIILANRSWLSSPQVRRALLRNHRLSKESVMTILRVTPKPELRLVLKQTAYPAQVREVATRLLK